MALRGQCKVSARKSIKASFAAESTGGAVTLTFNSSPMVPPISFFDDRGWTFTAKTRPSGRS